MFKSGLDYHSLPNLNPHSKSANDVKLTRNQFPRNSNKRLKRRTIDISIVIDDSGSNVIAS
jgi:hypothetical protein